MEKLSFRYQDLNVKPEIIAALMGYKEDIPAEINEIIESELEVASTIEEFRGAYLIKDVKLLKTNSQLEVDNVRFNVGKPTWKFYEHSEQVALIVSTAGEFISKRSRQLMKDDLLLEGYVVDIIGSVICEKAAIRTWERVKAICSLENKKVTNRYYPGYCNWDIVEQHSLFSLLPENFCNIQLTESALMLPTKSVSGIIGIGPNVVYRENACSNCKRVDCIYRHKKHY
ncbi:MAG: vitamin B12 dependent-methionine synthase activation domain-containing protein [Dysgonamonadaceae bacterium]|nr:vitamin B12 dependent-methionine synthase activation domain-containing protein [Dysgonamonadaceae bacterium]